MNRKRLFMIAAVLVGLLFVASWSIFSPRGARDFCGVKRSIFTRGPGHDYKRVGYEFLDLARGEVWLTVQFAPEEYEAFQFPIHWLFWQKNDPRTGAADHAHFLRSPGCEADGQFTYMRLHGKEFLQVVQLKKFLGALDKDGLIRGVQVEKYHSLTFLAGRSISILHAPDESRYIGVSQTSPARMVPATLPDGWSTSLHMLEEDLDVLLFEMVTVLRLDNEDSYQGPIREDALNFGAAFADESSGERPIP